MASAVLAGSRTDLRRLEQFILGNTRVHGSVCHCQRCPPDQIDGRDQALLETLQMLNNSALKHSI